VDYRSTRTFDLFLAVLNPEERDNALQSLAREAQRIRDVPAGPARARWVHARVNEALARFKATKPELMEQVRCGKGCAHCCRLWVGITRDDAALLAERVRAGTASADAERLEAQRHWDTPMVFVGKPAAQASCVFLGPDGACTVYEDRPTICRALLVASDPELCRADDPAAQVTAVINPNLDVIVSAALTVDAEGDPPPHYGRHLATALHAALTEPEARKDLPCPPSTP
jgi:Fe-S-cluster containining protein